MPRPTEVIVVFNCGHEQRMNTDDFTATIASPKGIQSLTCPNDRSVFSHVIPPGDPRYVEVPGDEPTEENTQPG